MGEVYNKDELDQDEAEASDHSDPHPGRPEIASWDEKRANDDTDDHQKLEEPKPAEHEFVQLGRRK